MNLTEPANQQTHDTLVNLHADSLFQGHFNPFLSQVKIRFSGEGPVYLHPNQTFLVASDELKEYLKKKIRFRNSKPFSK